MGRKKGPNIGKAIDSIFKTMGRLAKAAAAAEKKRQREANQRIREENRRINSMNRFYAQVERENLRRIKQEEMAERRAEREREKAMRNEEREMLRAEKEREKAAKLQAKLEKQQAIEEEISEIESDNYQWTNSHRLIDHIDSVEEVNDIFEKCNSEQQDLDATDCMFENPKPSKYDAESQAQTESNQLFNISRVQTELLQAEGNFNNYTLFNVSEPTLQDARTILEKEAESKITAFFPWKQKRLRNEYVSEHIDNQYEDMHSEWEKLKNEFETNKLQANNLVRIKRAELDKLIQDKTEYINHRTNEIYETNIKIWKEERDEFYAQLHDNLQDNLNGNKDYVITAVDDLFPNDDLDMDYFVDIAYDFESGKVLVDLDLPEIEDIPQQKIALTPSGKKSIRQKTQSDLRSDYVNCIFGLAMYVAYNISNVSVKITEIEISGYTQRKGDNSALATDQYVFLVDFTRDLFSEIDFQKYSSLEIMDFFKHHYNMTKSFDLKEIDLSTAYDKMETFTPADYNDQY